MATLTQTFDARVRLLTAVLDEALTVLGAKWVRWSADGVTVSAVVHWSFFNRGERLTVDVAFCWLLASGQTIEPLYRQM